MDRQNRIIMQYVEYQCFKDFPDQIFLINYKVILSDSQDKLIKYFLIITKIYELFIWEILSSKYNKVYETT